MATITPTVTKAKDNPKRDAYIVTWANMGNADQGLPVSLVGAADRTVQIGGTFGAATVVLEGSLDGTNYITLTDPQGNAISKTSAALEAVSEIVNFIRPSTSGGTGTSVTVTMLFRGMVE